MVSKSGHHGNGTRFTKASLVSWIVGGSAVGDRIRRGRWVRRSLLTAVATLVGVMAQAGTALAEELIDWRYDTQTRSLNITLPSTTAPSLSVLAPDQLLIELPDTQIGEVAGQTVGDGVVESVVLEQATPETVWMVMEFVPGTVLADVQNATQTTSEADDTRQWQIQPALMASRRTANTPIAVLPAETAVEPAVGADAGSLRSPVGPVAQAGDFSGLPVLEPADPLAVPEGVPVSVPPIDVPVSAPSIEEVPASLPPAPVTTTATPTPVEIPVVTEPALVESDRAADAVPSEPPFIGEVDGAEESQPVVVVPAIAAPPSVPSAAPPADRLAELPPAEPFVAEPAVVIEAAPVEGAPVQSVTPNDVDRWPEPLPFGQPLPEG